MKAANDDGDAGLAERPRDIERARILVGLHADQPDHAEAIGLAEPAQELWDVDAGVGLVDDIDLDVDIRPEHLALGAIERHAVQRGERVGRDQPAPPANDIAVVMVMRRLDQHDMEATTTHLQYSDPTSPPDLSVDDPSLLSARNRPLQCLCRRMWHGGHTG